MLRMLTRAGVCSRMLTYADVCSRVLTYADVCSRMLTRSWFNVAWTHIDKIVGRSAPQEFIEQVLRMLTHADVC
jgi:hypothetical protein